MNRKLKIGIIGCGGIANKKHMPSLAQLSDLCQMTAFCDLIPERAEAAAKSYGTVDAKTYTDYKDLLKDETIDVVHILTPNVYHAPLTIDAFAAGKHVMCEKPMAITSADAQAMINAAKKAGKKFTIGYQNRFREDAQTLHRACEQGALGEIYFAKAHALRRRGVPTWGVFPNKALQGGGPLIDIGTHALDLTLWCMNNYEPEAVMGSVFCKMADKWEGNLFGPYSPETYEVEDSAFGFVRMKNGATIFLESSWALNLTDTKEACTTLCGTEGGAEMFNGPQGNGFNLKFNTAKYGKLIDETPKLGQGGVAYFEGGNAAPGYLEAKSWLNSILNDTDPVVLPEQALVVTKILEAIYRANETRSIIQL